MTIDKAKAKKILVEELGYKGFHADIYLEDYPEIYEPLGSALNRWLEDRTIGDVLVGGISIKDIMKVHGCHFLMAVRELNVLLKPDLTEDERKELARIIQKPHILYDSPSKSY